MVQVPLFNVTVTTAHHSPVGTRRALLAGAAAGLVGATGAAAAGLGAPPAAAATTQTPDWLDVVNGFGADPTGKTDSTTAFQNAINALPAKTGGVVYVPAGTYKVNGGALQPVSGLRLTGDGSLCTIISTTANSMINAAAGGLLDSVEIDNLTLQATGSDLITGCDVARWRIHDCRLIQFSAGNAIWNAPSVTQLAECVFERNIEFVYGAARTIDAWYLACTSSPAQINQVSWRDNVCFNSGAGQPVVYDNSHYWYHLVQQAGGNVNQANSFVNIAFEHCSGGAINVESGIGTLIDNCWSYDTPAGTIANPLFSIRKNASGGAPQLTTIKNSGRLGTGLAAGVADIALDPACVDTTISGCGCNQGNAPFVFDLGNCSSVTLTGLPKSPTLLNAAGLPFISQQPGSAPQPEDLGYVGWAYDCAALTGAGVPLPTAGILYLIRVAVRVAKPITNVRIGMTAPGSGLTSGNLVGVYTSAGTQIGVSADQSTAWQGSAGVIDAPLSPGQVTVGPGFVWVALLFNGTTGPAVAGTAGSSPGLANGRLAAASARFGTILKGRTTLPAFITPASVTPTANQFWAAIW